jgi:HB1, ASXL, restriction endonuclease HTH domain
MPDDVRRILLETIESSLHAQLTAVRRLRKESASNSTAGSAKKRAGRSHMSIVFDILESAGHPLHINEIIAVAQKRFRQSLDRESLASALSKRVARADRFLRTAPNTFALRRSQIVKEE